MQTFVLPDKRHSQIQICPWFLQYVLGLKIRTKKDITPLLWAGLAKLMGPIVKRRYTPVDLASLFDTTMLHEVFDMENLNYSDKTDRRCSSLTHGLGARRLMWK